MIRTEKLDPGHPAEAELPHRHKDLDALTSEASVHGTARDGKENDRNFSAENLKHIALTDLTIVDNKSRPPLADLTIVENDMELSSGAQGYDPVRSDNGRHRRNRSSQLVAGPDVGGEGESIAAPTLHFSPGDAQPAQPKGADAQPQQFRPIDARNQHFSPGDAPNAVAPPPPLGANEAGNTPPRTGRLPDVPPNPVPDVPRTPNQNNGTAADTNNRRPNQIDAAPPPVDVRRTTVDAAPPSVEPAPPPADARRAPVDQRRTPDLDVPHGPDERMQPPPSDDTRPSARERTVMRPNFGPNVTLDANNQISKISYPAENKTREFGRDEYGEINKLVTTTPEGKFSYVKENGQWLFLAPDNHKYPAPNMMLDSNGEFSREARAGVVTTQRIDGSSFDENVTAVGARIKNGPEGAPELIKRADGSSVNAIYENGKLTKLVDTQDGDSITWTADKDGKWISDQKPPQTIQNLKVEQNGNVKYSAEGKDYIIRPNGAELQEGAGNSKFTFDEQGRFKSITTPDGKRTRSFSYDGNESEPSRVQITDSEKNETRTYVHQPEQGGWTQVDENNRPIGTWKGDIKIHDDGTYAVRAEGTAGDAWMSYHTDGTAQMESRRQNGTIAITNPSGELLSATRPDGTVVKANYDNSGLNEVKQQSANGEVTSWNKQADGTWKSNSPDYPDAVKKLSVNLDGEISFIDANHAKTTLKADGGSHMEKTDGSFVDADKDGLVRCVGIDKQNFRVLDYKNGELSSISETTKSGTNVWQRKPDGQEERQDIKVSSDGFVSYKVNGKTFIEGSNLAKMELNDKMSISRVSMPNGAIRDYSYDNRGSLQTITDQRVTPKGIKTEVWNKVAEGENGQNQFESRGADGKTKVRSDIHVDDSGDYLYRSNDGKPHSSRVRDLLRTGEQSQNVEEARANLEELAEAKGIKIDRFRKMMDDFEKRSKTAAESGLKGPTEAQIAKTYDTFGEILKGGGKNYFNEAERKALVEQTMYNISAPTRINQGRNPTCNITTGEIFTASRNPDKYADVIKQVALNGSLQTTTGKTFSVNRNAMKPTQEEAYFEPDADYKGSCRNWASHVFQLYGINSFTKFAQPNVLPSWGHEYTGFPDARGNAPNPCMDGNAIRTAVKELTGADMPYIAHMETPTENKLWEYKKAGNFPIGVPTLYQRMQDGSISEQHVQTIHDVREVNGRTQVYLDDQNGQANDRGWVDISELYQRQGLQAPVQGRSGPKFTRSRR